MEATICMGELAVRLVGGLGNQLFILAHGYAQAKRQHRKLVIDTSHWFAGQGEHPDTYRKTIFKNFEYGQGEPIGKGYYQGAKYFNPYGREFVGKLSLNLGYINGVAVHIRRGDYVGSNYEVCDDNYYKKAMAMFSGDKMIFTDDPEYCKRFDLPIFSGTTLEAFEAMASHHVVICSNSSFSWWASYVGKRLTVAPKRWYLDKIDQDIHRKDMILI
jgi:hypothetical protein